MRLAIARRQTCVGSINELKPLAGVDAVVTGHSHRVFPGKDYESLTGADLKRGTIEGKPYVMAGSFGSHLGVIDILLDDSSGRWSVKDSHAEARPVASKNDDGKMVARLPADPAVTELVKPWTEATLAYIRAPIGEAKGPFNTYLALLGDTAALRLVADAQRAYAEKLVKGTPYEGLPLLSAAAPFRVGGRPGPDYYTDVKAGPIAIKDAADLYIYPNMLTIVKLKGSEVREYLEKAARIFNQIDPAKAEPQQLIANMPAYNFDILFGLTYAIDVTKPLRYGRGPAIEDPNAWRISDVKYDGEPLKDDQDYLIITNNYRANGGGEFPRMDGSAIALVAPETNREILIDYIREKKEIAPDNTPVWRFVPVAGDADIRIEIGPKDLEKNACVLARRDRPGKEGKEMGVPLADAPARVAAALKDMQKSLFEKAKKFRDENSHEVNSYDDFKKLVEEPGGFLWAHWDGTRETEDKIATETKATIRCIPSNRKPETGKCMVTGKPSAGRVVFAKAY